jgi:hypothetical protein
VKENEHNIEDLLADVNALLDGKPAEQEASQESAQPQPKEKEAEKKVKKEPKKKSRKEKNPWVKSSCVL